jgi:formaldehyde-activating enzyme
MARDIDGAIGEGWGGEEQLTGSHVNVVIARRGGPTAAALMTAFTTPRPGHTPVLACVGAHPREYEPIWPPLVMMNKSTAVTDEHQKLTWGAAQLGLGQGVLDAVADGLLEANDDYIVFVAVWVNEASTDETAIRKANRAAIRKAIGVAVEGRDPAAAQAMVERRDELRNPFYTGA